VLLVNCKYHEECIYKITDKLFHCFSLVFNVEWWTVANVLIVIFKIFITNFNCNSLSCSATWTVLLSLILQLPSLLMNIFWKWFQQLSKKLVGKACCTVISTPMQAGLVTHCYYYVCRVCSALVIEKYCWAGSLQWHIYFSKLERK